MSIIIIKNNKLLLTTKLTIKTYLQLISLKHYLQVISFHKLLLIFIKKTFIQILLLITKLTIKSYLQLISLKKKLFSQGTTVNSLQDGYLWDRH